MEKAVSRLNSTIGQSPSPNASELGGEFPIFDLKTNENGVLEICMDGIGVTFNNQKEFIELKRVRKCTTQKDDIFVLEEFGKSLAQRKTYSYILINYYIKKDPKSKQIVLRKYKSTMVSRILKKYFDVSPKQLNVF